MIAHMTTTEVAPTVVYCLAAFLAGLLAAWSVRQWR